MGSTQVRSICFYLPQFHPIPENDEWWGPGFTEWTNVTRARPLGRWHYQPHLPADLGFYDLRLADSRAAQARMATAYGVHGFCYYHYWFSGRRILETPFEQVLASGEPDFPFMLCWANESWTRAWDGGISNKLLGQAYSEEDHREHARYLTTAFADPRYITIEGRPAFAVYRASDIPEIKRATDVWREEVTKAGLPEPYLLRVESTATEREHPGALGFDAAIEFQPKFDKIYDVVTGGRIHTLKSKVRGKLRIQRPEPLAIDYDRLVEMELGRELPDYKRYPGTTPSWDNTARRGRGGAILRNSTPSSFGRWTKEVVDRLVEREPDPEHRILFVNAWNEWAEGNHLEPDQKWGRAYLEAHRDGVTAAE